MIKQPSPAEDCLILQGNSLQKKRGKVEKNSQKAFKKAKERAFESGREVFAKKAEQSRKNSQKAFKKAKERAFESEAGKSLRSRKA